MPQRGKGCCPRRGEKINCRVGERLSPAKCASHADIYLHRRTHRSTLPCNYCAAATPGASFQPKVPSSLPAPIPTSNNPCAQANLRPNQNISPPCTGFAASSLPRDASAFALWSLRHPPPTRLLCPLNLLWASSARNAHPAVPSRLLLGPQQHSRRPRAPVSRKRTNAEAH